MGGQYFKMETAFNMLTTEALSIEVKEQMGHAMGNRVFGHIWTVKT